MANKKFTLPFRQTRDLCDPVPCNQDDSHVWLAHVEAEQQMSNCTLTLERIATLVRDYSYAAANDMKVTMKTKGNHPVERGYEFEVYDADTGAIYEDIVDDRGIPRTFMTGVSHLAVMAVRVHWFIHGLEEIEEGHLVAYNISILLAVPLSDT
jgi:hypothetical protein